VTAHVVPAVSVIGRGASPDADLVYRRLATLGRATAGELSRELGMPRRRVDQAVERLAALGWATARRLAGERGVFWVSRSPTEAAQATGEARRETPAAAGEPVPEVVAHAIDLGEGLRHIRTRAASRARLVELVALARHEHLAMNPEPRFDAEAARPAVAMDRALLDRGVSMRVLGVQPTTPDPMSPFGRPSTDPRPAYREMAAVPMKLFVVDRKVALFPVAPTDVSRGYLEVTQPSVVAALVEHFEQHWAVGHTAPVHPRFELSPREHALTALLARGHTDASAARELRISMRTVTTVVRSLMDRLSVENRFQLGLALGARRLVAPPIPVARVQASTRERGDASTAGFIDAG
jgi:DNA-binding CsgD family transcriptional regulator